MSGKRKKLTQEQVEKKKLMIGSNNPYKFVASTLDVLIPDIEDSFNHRPLDKDRLSELAQIGNEPIFNSPIVAVPLENRGDETFVTQNAFHAIIEQLKAMEIWISEK